MKKFLSILLSLLFIISACPMGPFGFSASAATSGYYTYSVADGKATINGVNTYISGAVEIPSILGGYPVVNINSAAFEGCTNITSLTVPDSVISIGSKAFEGCTKLTSVTISNSVVWIDGGVFHGCSSLESVTLPFVGASRNTNNTHQAVFGHIFGYALSINESGTTNQKYSSNASKYYYIPSSLKSVTITDATQIPYGAFYNCSNITSISIPDSVAIIGDNAFYNTSGLQTVYFGGSLEKWNTLKTNSGILCDNIIYPETTIAVETLPSKTKYVKNNETLNLAGGKISISYKDEQPDIIEMTDSKVTVTGFDNTKIGKQTLTVTYCGASTTFDIEIIENPQNTPEFAGGNGTVANPYLIETKEHLNNVRNYPDAHYKMLEDIVFTEADFAKGGAFYNSGAGWEPIGSEAKSFTGIFDGNGYCIKNIIINIQSEQTVFAGLFNTNSGTIKNLGIEGGYISIKYGSAGGVSGCNDNGIIENCFNTCDIKIQDETGSTILGGIVGVVYSGTVKNCYNTGHIYSTNNAGGIAGTNAGLIKNCFNTGYIQAIKGDNSYSCAGGISATNHNIIQSCYNVGYITSDITKGAISGFLMELANAKFVNCYYLNNVSSGEAYGDKGAIKCTAKHLQSQTTFSGFDFENVWRMPSESNYMYPELIGNSIHFTKKAQSISLVSLPYKTQYYVELENFDITGAKIAKIYNEGTVEEIAVTPSMVSGYDKTKVGEQTITIAYNGENLTFDITNLSLVYDYKLTTDETITLEHKANEVFDFISSDETTAKITKVSSIAISGSSQVKTIATISPLKPGYVIIRAVDKTGNVLFKSLLLIEEGNHKMEFVKTIKKATCTQKGEEKYRCAYCGFTQNRISSALGHKKVVDNKVNPTCTKTGLTEGKHCSRCKEVFIKQEIIDATNVHIWDNGTLNKSGNIIYNCDTCDGTYSKNLVSIKVTAKPNKLNYFEYENIDFAGMIITAYYDDNTNTQMTAWSAEYDMIKGKQNVTVKCYGKTDTFTITVNSKVPSAITSSKHTISGNNISKITAGTTVSSLLSGLNEGSYCKVYKGNSKVSGNTAVGTGMIVKIMDGNSEKASYTVIVTGDINGDGAISVTDMIAIKAHILNKSTLKGVYATAANINGDDEISITDFIKVKAKILGKGRITAR